MIHPSGASMSEPDRRYWRSRANRRVRKARLLRGMLRRSARLGLHAAVSAVLLYAGWRIVARLTTTREFALRQIEIVGTHRASLEQLRERLAPLAEHNLLDLDLAEIAALVREEPWVADAALRRILPGTLRVEVVEREPAAIALIGGVAHVVDSTGHVIGPSGPGLADDLPVLTGLDDLDRDALVAALSRGVALIERLRERTGPWLDGVSELDLSREDRVGVRTVDPGPALLLDPDEIERNLREYFEMRREIERHVGDALYVDLRFGRRISVMPRTPDPTIGGE